MKKLSVFFAIIFAMMGIVRADEGMWLPMFVERLNYVDMMKMGLQLTPEELYSINNSSLKDAIVGLSNGAHPRGFFCTGEIVSSNSLLFTNHHCGYSSIAALSTVEHDYLNEGFWARNFIKIDVIQRHVTVVILADVDQIDQVIVFHVPPLK